MSTVLFIVIVIVAVLLMSSRKPDTFRVERAATIHARPDRIFPLLNDFHN